MEAQLKPTGAEAIRSHAPAAGSKAAPSRSGGSPGATQSALGGHGGASLPPRNSVSLPTATAVAASRALSGGSGRRSHAPLAFPPVSESPHPASSATTMRSTARESRLMPPLHQRAGIVTTTGPPDHRGRRVRRPTMRQIQKRGRAVLAALPFAQSGSRWWSRSALVLSMETSSPQRSPHRLRWQAEATARPAS